MGRSWIGLLFLAFISTSCGPLPVGIRIHSTPMDEEDLGQILVGASTRSVESFAGEHHLRYRVLSEEPTVHEVIGLDDVTADRYFPGVEHFQNQLRKEKSWDSLQGPAIDVKKCKTPETDDLRPLLQWGSKTHPKIILKPLIFESRQDLEIELFSKFKHGVTQMWRVSNPVSAKYNGAFHNSLNLRIQPDAYGVYDVTLLGMNEDHYCTEVHVYFAVLNTDPYQYHPEKMDGRVQFKNEKTLKASFPFLEQISAWETRSTESAHRIRVAVLDSGIQMNVPDLNSVIARDDHNQPIGSNYLNHDLPPMDEQGHGTMVAGLIAGTVGGVTQNVDLIPIKVVNAFGFTDDGTVLGALMAATSMKAKLIHLSVGCFGNSCSTMKSSAQKVLDQYVYSRGSLVIAAAGNVEHGISTTNNRDNDEGGIFPQSLQSKALLTVAGLDEKMELADDSHFGAKTVHTAAPGGGPKEKGHLGPCHYLGANGETLYCRNFGTSFAAPLVTGAAARVLGDHPKMSLDELRQVLIESGDVRKTLQGKTVSGRSINLQSALKLGRKIF